MNYNVYETLRHVSENAKWQLMFWYLLAEGLDTVLYGTINGKQVGPIKTLIVLNYIF